MIAGVVGVYALVSAGAVVDVCGNCFVADCGTKLGPPDAPTIMGVGVTRGRVAAAFGVLSVTTNFTGVGVGSIRWTCPNTENAPANRDIVQKTTLVIIATLESCAA